MDSTNCMEIGTNEDHQPVIERRKCLKISLKEIVVMVALILSNISSYYTLDIPGSLQDALIKYLNLSTYSYALFYSVYSLPSSVFTIIGGYMIDSSIGKRKTAYIFLAVAVIGPILFAIGAQVNSYILMIIGRFIYGCGQGTIIGNVSFYYTMLWFKDTYASVMFSLSDNLGTIGTLLVYGFSNRLMLLISDNHPDKQALITTIMIVTSVSGITLITVVIYTLLKPTNPMMVNSGARGNIKDCLNFPLTFWIILFTYSTICNAIFVFEQFSQIMLVEEYGLTVNEANEPITVMNLTKIILAFPGGLLIDRIGRNYVFFIVSVCCPLISHILLVLKVYPNACLFIIGFGYSFTAASLWPMYGYILNEVNYGMGMGITNSLVNLTIFLYSQLAGKIIDTYGYIWVQIYFIIVLTFGLLALISLRFFDKKNAILLNMTPSQRKEYEQSMIATTSTEQLSTDDMSNERSYGSVNKNQ